MTAPKPKSKNPLQSVLPASYDLTQRGRFNENLQILAAMKAAQDRFLRHILSRYPEEFKNRKSDLSRCGDWLVLRYYPATKERFVAGGNTCLSPYCLPCQFRKAYVAAEAVYDFVWKHIQANPYYFPAFSEVVLDRVVPFKQIGEEFKAVKSVYKQILCQRPRTMQDVLGSLGGFHFRKENEAFRLSVRELLLVELPDPVFPAADFRELVFPQILHVMLCSVINAEGDLSCKRQADLVRLTHGTVVVPYGCFSKFVLPKDSVADHVPDRLDDQDYFEEQYQYIRAEQKYVLQHILSVDDRNNALSKRTTRAPSFRSAVKCKKALLRQRREQTMAQYLHRL